MHKYTWIYPNILHVKAPNQFELCSLVYRMSHFYEFPGFKGLRLNVHELNAYYYRMHGDKHYWKKQYNGANLPDFALRAFKKIHKLNEREKPLFKILRPKLEANEKFYVIVSVSDKYDDFAFKHELAHAFWYLDEQYRQSALALINEYPKISSIILNKLEKMGYDGDVLCDEAHVYAGVYFDYYFADLWHYPGALELRGRLIELFNDKVESLEEFKCQKDTQDT
jgi:hypothetical protein